MAFNLFPRVPGGRSSFLEKLAGFAIKGAGWKKTEKDFSLHLSPIAAMISGRLYWP